MLITMLSTRYVGFTAVFIMLIERENNILFQCLRHKNNRLLTGVSNVTQALSEPHG